MAIRWSDSDRGIGEPSSNLSRVRCIHLRENTLGARMNPSLLSPAMGIAEYTWRQPPASLTNLTKPKLAQCGHHGYSPENMVSRGGVPPTEVSRPWIWIC